MERFGIQDHDAQVTNHALQNPTNAGSWANIGGGDDSAWTSSGSFANTSGGGGYGPASVTYSGMPVLADIPRSKTIVIAVILALVFGPFGVAYTSFIGAVVLFGVTALAGIATGGVRALDNDAIMVPIWRVMVVVSVIWTVIAARRFNAREKARWEANRKSAT
jgi:hypothetical protein